MKKLSVLLLFILSIALQKAFAQSKPKKFLKIDNQTYYDQDFIKLFVQQGVNDSLKQEDFDKDVDLFINYKLKLKQAYALQIDTTSSYQSEIKKYRDQLALPYMQDQKHRDSIVRQAYQRSLKEIRASHILIKATKDTMVAFNKITDIKNRLLKGEPFDKLAVQFSEDPSAKTNKGDLGYFSVFKMVFPFEEAAFSTQKGQLSDIVKTRFGYHVLKVNDVRESKGKVIAAHLMLRDRTTAGKKRIQSYYEQILQGASFDSLVKVHSDDRRTANAGGKLKAFGEFDLPKPFGEVAFKLTAAQPYSKPFKTAYGYHIVKLISKEQVGSFEDEKKAIEDKLKQSNRFQVLPNPVVNKLKKKYHIQVFDTALKPFFATDSLGQSTAANLPLLLIESDTIKQIDFKNYLKKSRAKNVSEVFDQFKEEKILDYYKNKLHLYEPKFADLYNNYKNGLLIFDLMKLKIWDKASNDTIGLKNFYELNKDKYLSKPSYEVLALRASNTSKDMVYDYLSELSGLDQFEKADLEKLNASVVQQGIIEKDHRYLATFQDLKIGEMQDKSSGNNIEIVKVFREVAPRIQTLEKVRGRVIGDYQKEVENKWIEALRDGHYIKRYKYRLKKVKSKYYKS